MDDTAGLADPGRLQAFSDGVFAIAITLLVLEVRVPGEPQVEAHGGSLVLALLAGWPVLLAYLVSFATVAVIWLNHHSFFDRVRKVDGTLQWLNLTLLLFVAFTPFPNALMAEYLSRDVWDEPARTATALYALIFAGSNVVWYLLWTHLVRRPALLVPPADAALARRERPRAVYGLIAYGIGAGVAALAPVVALVLFLAAAVYYSVTAGGRGPARASLPLTGTPD